MANIQIVRTQKGLESIMNFANIPAELRELNQWVVWRLHTRGNTTTKKPCNAFNPSVGADPTDPKTWADYETALQVVRSNPNFGLGFVFTENDPYIGIDIDDLSKVSEDLKESRQTLAGYLLRGASYTEQSPSGKGHHIICRGKMPTSAHVVRAMQIEMYAHSRFFTMTGKVDGDALPIADMQVDIDGFRNAFPKSDRAAYEEIEMLETLANGRRLDLTDDQVVEFAMANVYGFQSRYEGIDVRDWSETHRNLIGDIDKITGDPEQVRRIVYGSPLVQAQPAKNGETRANKSNRIFASQLAEVRARYDHEDTNYRSNPNFIAHGRELCEVMARYREEQAKSLAEAIRAASLAVEGLSRGSASLLDAFPQLTTEHKLLTPPPGVTGDFVEATSLASPKPFLKYSIPATLSTLAGVVSRKYKLPNGAGLHANYVLVAPTAAGKGSVMGVWEDFTEQALRELRTSSIQNKNAKSRIVNASTSSIQAMFPSFQETPSLVWYVEEAFSLLSAMNAPQGKGSTTSEQLRDAFNMLYDAGKTFKPFEVPKSVRGAKDNQEPVVNLNVSTFWTTVPSKFEVFGNDALDGFLSRVTIIMHKGVSGQMQRYTQSKLRDDLLKILYERMRDALELDQLYSMAVEQGALKVITISTHLIDDLIWEFIQSSEQINNAATIGTLPSSYTAISRLPMTAQRIAGLLAVMENPYVPVITPEQFKWAFGYLLQNLMTVLSNVDKGELGATMSMDIEVVVRELKHELMKDKATTGVKSGVFVNKLRRVKPFSTMPVPGDAVKRTIDQMLANDMLREEIVHGHGRPGKMYCPTDSEVWAG